MYCHKQAPELMGALAVIDFPLQEGDPSAQRLNCADALGLGALHCRHNL